MAKQSEEINKYGKLHYKIQFEQNSHNLLVNVLSYEPLSRYEGITVSVQLLPGNLDSSVKQKYKFNKFTQPLVLKKVKIEETDLTVVIRVKKKNLMKAVQFSGEVQVPLKGSPISECRVLHELSSEEGEEPILKKETNSNQRGNWPPAHGKKTAPLQQNTSNLLTKPWREQNTKTLWTEDMYTKLKQEIVKHELDYKVKYFNIILLGQIGSGKSSFVNTVKTVFGKDVNDEANVGGGAGGEGDTSFTKKYIRYTIQTEDKTEIKFRLCDSMGLEVEDSGLNAENVAMILDGHTNDLADLSTKDVIQKHNNYNRYPTENDKIHCVAFVVNARTVDFMDPKMLEKVNLIREEATERYLPTFIILTHVDKACTEVAEDITKVYMSRTIKEKVITISQKFGIKESNVFPVQNYSFQTEKDQGIDILNLKTLSQFRRSSEQFFETKKTRDSEKQKKQKEEEDEKERRQKIEKDEEEEEETKKKKRKEEEEKRKNTQLLYSSDI